MRALKEGRLGKMEMKNNLKKRQISEKKYEGKGVSEGKGIMNLNLDFFGRLGNVFEQDYGGCAG